MNWQYIFKKNGNYCIEFNVLTRVTHLAKVIRQQFQLVLHTPKPRRPQTYRHGNAIARDHISQYAVLIYNTNKVYAWFIQNEPSMC